MKKIFAIALAILMLLSLCACGAQKTEIAAAQTESELSSKAADSEHSAETAESYAIKYDLKINPEMTVCADQDLYVTEVTAENEDAEALLANMDIVGLSVNEAFGIITEEAKTQGFMAPEKGNTVDITIVEKDESLPTCPVCGGCGSIICLECNGTGICCDCERCNGTGLAHYGASPQCPHCGGSGLCHDCGGSGQVIVTNGEDGGIVYVAEGVPEMGICAGCNGKGVCLNCYGRDYGEAEHDEICEGCNGTGKIYCHDDLNGYRWCPCCWGSGIEGTGDPNYKQWMAENGY